MQNTTFEKPLKESDYQAYDEWCEWCNQNNYVILEDDDHYFCVSCEPTEAEKTALKIKQLKQMLADTDYKAIKYAEGYISAEDYAETKAQRQAWRNQINELEQLLEEGE